MKYSPFIYTVIVNGDRILVTSDSLEAFLVYKGYREQLGIHAVRLIQTDNK